MESVKLKFPRKFTSEAPHLSHLTFETSKKKRTQDDMCEKMMGKRKRSRTTDASMELGSPSERLQTSAQETLMQMIDDRASDKVVENQLKIIKMLRMRHTSQDLSQKATFEHQQQDNNLKELPQTKVHKRLAPKALKPNPLPSNPRFIFSPIPDTHPVISSPSSPKRKKCQSNAFITQKAQGQTVPQTKELLKTARPAAMPTSLPATQRTNKSLTTQEVASLSITHPTFDEEGTNKFDRHTRKINGTAARASDKAVTKGRGMQDRIRAPTESADEDENEEEEEAAVPRSSVMMSHRGIPRSSTCGRGRGGRGAAKSVSAESGRLRLNAETLRAVASAAADVQLGKERYVTLNGVSNMAGMKQRATENRIRTSIEDSEEQNNNVEKQAAVPKRHCKLSKKSFLRKGVSVPVPGILLGRSPCGVQIGARAEGRATIVEGKTPRPDAEPSYSYRSSSSAASSDAALQETQQLSADEEFTAVNAQLDKENQSALTAVPKVPTMVPVATATATADIGEREPGMAELLRKTERRRHQYFEERDSDDD